MNSDYLLGKWLTAIIKKHFETQSKANTEKVFMKISGLTTDNISALLTNITKSNSDMEKYYNVKIRTITIMDGYEKFSYKEHETSTWLRNNAKYGEALILIINEMTPEAQSLENLFTIDESYLLEKQSLEVLFNVINEEGNIVSQEIDDVKTFLEMTNKVFEPQLRNLLNFVTDVLKDDSPSVIDGIQQNLPSLNLFVDSKLTIKKDNIKRLRDNFKLANLQDVDPEKLLNNLYQFLEEEEKNDFCSDIFEKISSDMLRSQVVSFINQEDNELLKQEFENINSIFKFKKKVKLIDQVKEIYERSEELSDEQKDKYLEGIEEIESQENPDLMQEFLEEFEPQLNQEKGLTRKISRLIEKKRHPSEYDDLTYALMYEIFTLIDESIEADEDVDLSNATFKLSVNNSKVTESTKQLITLLLKNINKVIPKVTFDETSIPHPKSDTKNSDVTFNLQLNVNNNITNKKFKVFSLDSLHVNSILEIINEMKIVPYITTFDENQVEVNDIRNVVHEKVRYYFETDEFNMKDHYEKFTSFIDDYKYMLENIIENGIFSMKVEEYERKLSDLLENVYESVSVNKHIYFALNLIGAIDSYSDDEGNSDLPSGRLLTVINPIRLLAYIKRFEKISEQIEEWMNRASNNSLEVEKIEEYLQYTYDSTRKLAPRYFSIDGDSSFLIENNELMGEGEFILSSRPPENVGHLSKELSKELVKVVKNYQEVYPYSRDGLDILFLHCQSADIIIEAVKSLFKYTPVKKLKITIHSEQAAVIHHKINKWIIHQEEYTKPELFKSFPKLEINVISGKNINDIKDLSDRHMMDSDLAILLDYFGQTNQVNYQLEKIKPQPSNDWFATIYKEPLKQEEMVKRIPFVSEHIPNLLLNYYQLQYTVNSNAMSSSDELHVLQNLISVNKKSNEQIIDFMHDHFNWAMIMDRYLDKSLLQKASSKAEIIQYKSKAGSNKEFKLILSSSKYIRKLSDKTMDYEYYDRFTRKLMSILMNENISKDKIVSAVNNVKEISGALVLKVLGAGKFSHEMLATHLSTERRTRDDSSILQVWSSCDELPWFASNKRRPDLVLTTISEKNGKLKLNFDLIELKFVTHSILDKERFDAVKQVKAGESLYNKLFKFDDNYTDAEFWREELVHYFVERGSYIPEHVSLLKKLQHTSVQDINVEISASIDVYCYTSNLTDTALKKLEDGVYFEALEEEYNNYIFNRSFILNRLGAKEEVTPNYDDVMLEDRETKQDILEHVIKDDEDKLIEATSEEFNDNDKKDGLTTKVEQGENQSNKNVSHKESKDDCAPETINYEHENKQQRTEVNKLTSDEKKPTQDESLDGEYPEIAALKDLTLQYEDTSNDIRSVINEYIRKLKHNFNQNGIHVKIPEENAIAGSSVIRLYLDYPSNVPFKKITSKIKDIQVWLGLSETPIINIDKKGSYIDISREKPDTIYFEKFMEMVREQSKDRIKNTNLIAPLGLDPLNQVINVDLADSITPHLLVGGTTGSGKSVTLNSIILGIMCLYSNEAVNFIFIDPKQVEFNFYQEKTHTKKVITDINTAVVELESLVDEMERRYSLMNKQYVSNLEDYIQHTKDILPRIVIVFDEFADFMSQDKETAKRVETAIQRLGQKARAAGIHLIICTQNPKAEIINTKIRSNLPARLALRATDSTASTIILDEDGAEKLGGKGDFLVKLGTSAIRGKSPFLTVQVKRALLTYFEK
ncbi:FtsK/SpoIIIE domain-containing protein [Saliterribacillus persicus]|uniref:S-DNA-T family DNA segregation ATPase FtsK/SpoIIIE n=1 Tax=Saliterribacillus persicus TaxID=930114 RepID=A0A368X5U8_9BACI|nr:FtsK/SpoIIIE domain-containing protein [Saliterribacillus persicus]RCW63391.1 S-DNA-T family DNA segregation ATPase FtsK/SpoIIIE [Saliterribacillus persicus]